jgi:translation initiation factor 5B
VAIEGATVGRQINEEDIVYIDLIESAYKQFPDIDLNDDEKMALEETVAIKRKEEPFWGM